jgi:hypothetical protein
MIARWTSSSCASLRISASRCGERPAADHGPDDLRLDAAVTGQLGADRGRRGAVADEEAALGVDKSQRERTRRAATEHQQQHERQPQAQRLTAIERPVDDQAAGEPRRQRADRGDMEQLRRLVQRRLAQQRLVAVVQTEELCPYEQDRNRHDARRGERQRTRGQLHRQHERAGERGDVGDVEHAPIERVAADARFRPTRLGDRAQRRAAAHGRDAESARARRPATGDDRPLGCGADLALHRRRECLTAPPRRRLRNLE